MKPRKSFILFIDLGHFYSFYLTWESDKTDAEEMRVSSEKDTRNSCSVKSNRSIALRWDITGHEDTGT
jgi:hypothetical protein